MFLMLKIIVIRSCIGFGAGQLGCIGPTFLDDTIRYIALLFNMFEILIFHINLPSDIFLKSRRAQVVLK